MNARDWALIVFAVGLGLLPCLFALAMRYELRIRRLKSLLEVYRQFGGPGGQQDTSGSSEKVENAAGTGAQDAGTVKNTETKPASVKPGTSEEAPPSLNPLVEFVKAKYTADLPEISDQNIENKTTEFANRYNKEQKIDSQTMEIAAHIDNARRLRSLRNGPLILGAILFGVSSSIGFYAVVNSLLSNFTTVFPSCFSLSCRIDGGRDVLVIGSIVFVGGYIAAMRLIIQAVTSFDLTGYTFVRQGGEVLFSVLLGMLIYAAFPDPMQSFGKVMLTNDTIAELALAEKQKRTAAQDLYESKCIAKSGTTGQNAQQSAPTPSPECERVRDEMAGVSQKKIPWYWIVLAVVFGLVPISSTRYLLKKAQDFFRWNKTTDERFADITRVTPVDILDGIDFETRYRLEECGLRDVQNLACANPIMLAIESPFNLNEIIDWIGQAQLCHIVGVERYMLLREYNIRTIFDLERAIDSKASPETFDIIYGSILLSPTEAMKSAAEKTRIKFLIDDDNSVKHVSLEEFTSWAYKKILQSPPRPNEIIGPPPENPPYPKSGMSQAVEHMMYWISDDLHVRRLRRLWIDIEHALKPDSAYFSDSKRREEEKRKAKGQAN